MFFRSSKRFSLIIVLFRLLTAVPSQSGLYRQILGGLPAQGRFEGELRDHREVIAGALVLVFDHVGGVVAPGDALANRYVQRTFQTLDYRFRHVFPRINCCTGAAGGDPGPARFVFFRDSRCRSRLRQPALWNSSPSSLLTLVSAFRLSLPIR